MVTLATAVNTTATTWHLSGALPDDTEYIQVDDELVAVITPAIRESQRDPFTLFCEVERGVAGDVTSHSQGATLTTLPNPPLGGGSGSGVTVDNTVDPPAEIATLIAPGATIDGDEATLAAVDVTTSLIGPFSFSFNETDNFKALADLAEGTTVLLAWPEFVTVFNNEGVTDVTFEIYVGPIAGDWLLLSQNENNNDNTKVDAAAPSEIFATTVADLRSSSYRPARIKTAGCSLIGSLNIGDAQPTAGALNVYALIATPA